MKSLAKNFRNALARLDSRRHLLCLLALALAVTIIDYFGYRNFSDNEGRNISFAAVLSKKAHISILFEGLLLMQIVALLALILARALRQTRRHRVQWSILTAIFCLLLLFKVTRIDNGLLRILRSFDQAGHVPVSSSIMFFGMLFILAALLPLFYRFLRELAPRQRNTFIIAGVVFVTGFIFVEYIGEYFWAFYGASSSTLYNVSNAIENTCEESGLALFIFGLLEYVQNELR